MAFLGSTTTATYSGLSEDALGYTENQTEDYLGSTVVVSVTSDGSVIESQTTGMGAGFPQPHPTCVVVDFALHGVIIAILFILGLTGNLLSCITFWSTKLQNATSFLLIWLAVCDSGVLIFWFLLVSVPRMCTYLRACDNFMQYSYIFTQVYVWPVASFFHLASTWVVTLVTFHRFIGVCYPTRNKNWCSMKATYIQTAVIIVGAAIFNIPRWFERRAYMSEDGTKVVFENTALRKSQPYQIGYAIALYYLVICIVPFIMLAYMTYHLIMALKVAKRQGQVMSSNKRDVNDLTRTLIVIVIVFIICQCTNPIRRAMSALIPIERQGCDSVVNYFGMVTSDLICFNSAINFILYCLFSRRFRKQLMKKLHLGSSQTAPFDSSNGVSSSHKDFGSSRSGVTRVSDAVPLETLTDKN